MAKTYTIYGSDGLKQYGGFVDEEILSELKGQNGIKRYRAMADNDPVVGSILFAITSLLRGAKWEAIPFDESPEANNAAMFIDDCMESMDDSWGDMIAEALSMLIYGYSFHEIIYKKRSDGMIGWQNFALRPQDSLYRWVYNGDTLESFEQQTLTGIRAVIPMSKGILFRTSKAKNNPEGRSLLRNAYKPYKMKSQIEVIEGIGIERDLAGLPVVLVPPSMLSTNASDSDKVALANLKSLVTKIRRDEMEGVVFPLAYDDKGNKLFDLQLLNSGGQRNFDTDKIIMRYNKLIAMTVLADFIFLGQDKAGSFALSSDKTAMFSNAIGGIIKTLEETLNKQAVERLCRLNGIEQFPKIKCGDIEKQDIAKFSDAVSKLVQSGVLIPDDTLKSKSEELLDLR